MKKMKYILVLLSLIATIAVSSVAHAFTLHGYDYMYVVAEVNPVAVITPCSSVAFTSSFSANSGQVSPSCNVDAYSNDSDGFYIEIYGGDLAHAIWGTAWDDIPMLTTGGMDTSCTSNCTEAWGWRIVNGTASEYTVLTDSNNQTKSFDSNATNCGGDLDEPCWHTVQGFTDIETIITNGTGIANTSEFDLQFGAVTDSTTTSGNYLSTITLTITAN